MHIYIDESGVFRPADHPDAWCAVAAYVLPESKIRHLNSVLTPLKLRAGKTYRDEVKLRHVQESDYLQFLSRLSSLNGSLFCVATDMSMLTEQDVRHHQSGQAKLILSNIDRMHYESAREGLRDLAAKTESISPQLYMQLVCQVHLLKEVIDRGILYHVQRHPKFLGKFRWRIDQKNTSKIAYEEAFEILAPALLQSISLRDPTISVREFDYSAMAKYRYGENDAPTYLQDEYGIDIDAEGALNVGKLLGDDCAFTSSSIEPGIQVVDLLVSGIRRSLKGQFSDQRAVSKLLGRLMVQRMTNEPPIRLVSFSDGTVDSPVTRAAIQCFTICASPLMR